MISPLLANIYLHQLDEAFEHDPDSPRRFANARLVRYADDFVVMARYMGGRVVNWLEQRLESELELTINREKTKIVKMRKPGESLDFLGFTLLHRVMSCNEDDGIAVYWKSVRTVRRGLRANPRSYSTGGMAGVCAALSAARNGIKTVLVQDRPVLGGNASSEIRMWICGAQGADDKETGILEELMLRNMRENPRLLYAQWDHVLYGTCMEEPNLTVLLNCCVMDLGTEGARITKVRAWHMSQQCFFGIEARLFADCSGDSVLRYSGAAWRRGREGRDVFNESLAPEASDNKTMGNSILIQLRHTDRHEPFVYPSWAHHYTDETVPTRDLRADGHNFWWLEVGGTQDTISDADAIRDELLKVAYGVWAYIKNHPDGRARNWELDWIGSLPGKRENVRYVGDHTLTQDDIRSEGRFDDMVAYGGWPMDDHHPEGIEYPGAPTVFHGSPSPFGIPYRSLYSRNIENLFFAGRNISASHMALSSTRVMATCAVMGQAMGTAASIAIHKDLTPRGVYEKAIAELQDILTEQDCHLPWHVRTIPALSRNATLTASCSDPAILLDGIERDLAAEPAPALKGDPDGTHNPKRKKLDLTDHGWWGGANDWVAYNWSIPTVIESVRLVLDSDLQMNKRMLCRYPKDMPAVSMPAMLARDFEIECCDRQGNWTPVHEIRDNRKRWIQLEGSSESYTGCRLRIIRMWGDQDAHVFGFDVTSAVQKERTK